MFAGFQLWMFNSLEPLKLLCETILRHSGA